VERRGKDSISPLALRREGILETQDVRIVVNIMLFYARPYCTETHFSCACRFGKHFIIFTYDAASITCKAREILAGDFYLRIYFNINLCATTSGNYEIRMSRQTNASCADFLSNIYTYDKRINAIYVLLHYRIFARNKYLQRVAGILRCFLMPSAHTRESVLFKSLTGISVLFVE
jgi:hypothetical protein